MTIASRAAPARAPANVTIGELDPRRYEERFRSASIVVVALAPRRDRSAGQQTYLNAMVLGKPVVVTDALGVREYVEDRRTGLIVPAGRRAPPCAPRSTGCSTRPTRTRCALSVSAREPRRSSASDPSGT